MSWRRDDIKMVSHRLEGITTWCRDGGMANTRRRHSSIMTASRHEARATASHQRHDWFMAFRRLGVFFCLPFQTEAPCGERNGSFQIDLAACPVTKRPCRDRLCNSSARVSALVGLFACGGNDSGHPTTVFMSLTRITSPTPQPNTGRHEKWACRTLGFATSEAPEF